MPQIAEGMNYLHSKGLVHCDLGKFNVRSSGQAPLDCQNLGFWQHKSQNGQYHIHKPDSEHRLNHVYGT
jgi:serine/threonine protein kinase